MGSTLSQTKSDAITTTSDRTGWCRDGGGGEDGLPLFEPHESSSSSSSSSDDETSRRSRQTPRQTSIMLLSQQQQQSLSATAATVINDEDGCVDATRVAGLLDLPTILLHEIIMYTNDLRDVGRFACVNQEIARICNEPELWVEMHRVRWRFVPSAWLTKDYYVERDRIDMESIRLLKECKSESDRPRLFNLHQSEEFRRTRSPRIEDKISFHYTVLGFNARRLGSIARRRWHIPGCAMDACLRIVMSEDRCLDPDMKKTARHVFRFLYTAEVCEKLKDLRSRPNTAATLEEAAILVSSVLSLRVTKPGKKRIEALMLDKIAEKVREHLLSTSGKRAGHSLVETVRALNRVMFSGTDGFVVLPASPQPQMEHRIVTLEVALWERTGTSVMVALIYVLVGNRLGVDIGMMWLPGHRDHATVLITKLGWYVDLYDRGNVVVGQNKMLAIIKHYPKCPTRTHETPTSEYLQPCHVQYSIWALLLSQLWRKKDDHFLSWKLAALLVMVVDVIVERPHRSMDPFEFLLDGRVDQTYILSRYYGDTAGNGNVV